MKKITNKRGISLIVLVITIIVMIILAAAIILSLSNSGIIGKADEAKTASDNANLLEAANLAAAEWELEDKLGKNPGSAKTYIEGKLTDQGFTSDQIAKLNITDDGKVSLKEDKAVAITGDYKFLSTTGSYNTMTLTANQDVTWTSNDNNIATVNENGLVTGVATGTATITATAGSKTATYEVKVGGIIEFKLMDLMGQRTDGSLEEGRAEKFEVIDGMTWKEYFEDDRFDCGDWAHLGTSYNYIDGVRVEVEWVLNRNNDPLAVNHSIVDGEWFSISGVDDIILRIEKVCYYFN